MYPFWHQIALDRSLHLSRGGIKTSTVFISQSCRMNGYESATTSIMAVLDPGVALLGLLYRQAVSLPLAQPATSQATPGTQSMLSKYILKKDTANPQATQFTCTQSKEMLSHSGDPTPGRSRQTKRQGRKKAIPNGTQILWEHTDPRKARYACKSPIP